MELKSKGKAYVEGIDVASRVAAGVNDLAGEGFIKGFVDRMQVEHRTLQQSFTRLCVAWFLSLADRTDWDLRNEASILLAKKIKQDLEDSPLPFV